MNKRICMIDYLKAFAILSVIYMHCEIGESVAGLKFGDPFWLRIPVPIFMFISGYTFTLSLEKNGSGFHAAKAWYSPRILLQKCSRFIIPMLPIYFIRVLKDNYVDHHSVTIGMFFKNLILGGGSGPGSYYFPCIMCLLLIFPFIYLVIKYAKIWGLILLLFLQIVYAASCVIVFPEDMLRNIYFNYLFLTSCGVYLYLFAETIRKNIIVVCGLIGFLYILNVNYLHPQLSFIPFRTGSAYPTSFFLMPFMYFFLYKHKDFTIKRRYLHNIISIIGAASYHILWVQLLWFASGFDRSIFNNQYIQLAISLIICTITGVLYYQLETWIRKVIKGHRISSILHTMIRIQG